MRRKPESDVNPFHIFIGLLVGFLLGTTAVYWHSNRQNDRIYTETLDRVMAWFTAQNIQFDPADSIINLLEDDGLTGAHSLNAPAFPSTASPTPFRLAQDRMLHTKTIKIENAARNPSAAEKRLDTLLGRTPQSANGQIYFLEFWESPLNYVGYKMGKNKIIIYGLRSFDMVSLVSYQGKIFLRYQNEFYPLSITNTYKPLVPSNDMFFTRDFPIY